MGCANHFAAVFVQGIGFAIDASDVPQSMLDGHISRQHEDFKAPPLGSTVFYGGIFNYCPRCGDKLNLSECGPAARKVS